MKTRDSKRTRVLVALDGTEEPEATVATLCATQPGAHDLVLLVVLPEWCTAELANQAWRRLVQAAARLGGSGERVEIDVRLGERVAETVNAAREHEVDVIAMVRHSRPRLERWLLGSVADEVVRQAPVPVLLLGTSENGGLGDGARRPPRHVVERKVRRLAPAWR